jgi:hypothetical protein
LIPSWEKTSVSQRAFKTLNPNGYEEKVRRGLDNHTITCPNTTNVIVANQQVS